MARVDLDRVADHIARLPADKRALLERSLGGDSCAEIADPLGQPVAAVKSKLWRTRCALREQMGVDVAAWREREPATGC